MIFDLFKNKNYFEIGLLFKPAIRMEDAQFTLKSTILDKCRYLDYCYLSDNMDTYIYIQKQMWNRKKTWNYDWYNKKYDYYNLTEIRKNSRDHDIIMTCSSSKVPTWISVFDVYVATYDKEYIIVVKKISITKESALYKEFLALYQMKDKYNL